MFSLLLTCAHLCSLVLTCAYLCSLVLTCAYLCRLVLTTFHMWRCRIPTQWSGGKRPLGSGRTTSQWGRRPFPSTCCSPGLTTCTAYPTTRPACRSGRPQVRGDFFAQSRCVRNSLHLPGLYTTSVLIYTPLGTPLVLRAGIERCCAVLPFQPLRLLWYFGFLTLGESGMAGCKTRGGSACGCLAASP